MAGNWRLRQTVGMGVIDICYLQHLRVTAALFTSCISIKSQGVVMSVNKNIFCRLQIS